MGAGRALLASGLAAAVLAACGGGDEDEPSLPAAPDAIQFSTPDFKDGGAIPAALTCDGDGKPPTLVWRAVPAGAVELVLVVEDADAPDGAFTHWTAFGLPASGGSGLAPDGRFPAGVKSGRNSAGGEGWAPPCPPRGDDAHTYTFALYAIPQASALEAGAAPEAVRAALEDAVGRGTFTGTYERG